MHDFGIEEKEFQLMLDVATEKMEMNEVTFGLISDTMRRVRDSGKLDDYTRTQVGLLCNDFSVAIEKLNNKTEYEVAMEEMSGGMMALVAAAIAAVSFILAKILGFFGGSSSSGNVISYSLEIKTKKIDDLKSGFSKINPDLNYICPILEKIEKEIYNLPDDLINLITKDEIKNSIKEIKSKRSSIFNLLPSNKLSSIKSICDAHDGYLFTKDNFNGLGTMRGIEYKLEPFMSKLSSIETVLEHFSINALKEEVDKASKEYDLLDTIELKKERLIKLLVLAEYSKDEYLNNINELTKNVEELVAESDERENKNLYLKQNVDYDEECLFLENIIFKRDEYPNIFNTFATDGVKSGSAFIKRLLEIIDKIATIKDYEDKNKENNQAVFDSFYKKAIVDHDSLVIALMREISNCIRANGAYLSKVAMLIIHGMKMFDMTCNLTIVFFRVLIDISSEIKNLNRAISNDDRLNKTELSNLVKKYIDAYDNNIVRRCEEVTKIYDTKNTNMFKGFLINKLLNHMSGMGKDLH